MKTAIACAALACLVSTVALSADLVLNPDGPPEWDLPKTEAENWRFYPVEWQTMPLGDPQGSSFQLETTLTLGAYRFAEPLYDTGQYCRFGSMAQYHFQGGIAFGYTDERSQYRLQFSLKEKSVALWKTPGNFLAVADFPIEQDRPFTVKLTVDGAMIRASVNEKEVIQVRDRIEPLGSGKLLGGANHAVVRFANTKLSATPASTAPQPAAHSPSFSTRNWCGYRWVFDGPEPIARLGEGKDGKAWSWHPVALYEAKLRPGTRPANYIVTAFNGAGTWPEKPFDILEVKPEIVKLRAHVLLKKSADEEPAVRTTTDVTIAYQPAGDTYTYTMDSQMEYLQDHHSVVEILDPFPYGCCKPAYPGTKPYDGRYQYIVVRGDDGKLYRRPLNHFARPVLLTLDAKEPLVAYLGETDVNPVYEILGPSLKHRYHASMCMVLQDLHVQRQDWPKEEVAGTRHHDQWRVSSVHGEKAQAMLESATWHELWKPQVDQQAALFIPTGTTFSGDQVVPAVTPCGTQAFDSYSHYTIDPQEGHDAPGSMRLEANRGTYAIKARDGLAAFGKAFSTGPCTIRLFAKAKDLDGEFTLATLYPAKIEAQGKPITGTTDGWVPVELKIDVGAETPYVEFTFGIKAKRGAKGTVWVDDVSMIQHPLPSVGAGRERGSALAPRRYTIEDFLNRKSIHGRSILSMSPDGHYLAATLQSSAHNESVAEGENATPQGILAENVGNRVVILDTGSGESIDPWPEDSTGFSPRWSPDGKHLAVYLRDGAAHLAMALWNRETRSVRMFPEAKVGVQVAWQGCSWAPDSSCLYFTHVEPDPDVPARKSTDPDVKVWRNDPSFKLWTKEEQSPKAFGRALVKLDVNTGAMKTLATYATPAHFRVSPDGRHIAYLRVTGRDAQQYKLLFSLFLIPTDGTKPPREAARDFPGFWEPTFSWSPTSDAISVALDNTFTVVGLGDADQPVVIKMPKADSAFDTIAPPVWSRDGKSLFARTKSQVWQIRRETCEARQIVKDLDDIQWLHQGKYAEPAQPNPDGCIWLSDKNGLLLMDLKDGNIAKRIDNSKAVHASLLNNERVMDAQGEKVGMKTKYQVFVLNLKTAELKELLAVREDESGIAKGLRKTVEWTLPDGTKRSDPILLPPDYQEGQRVPVVIELYAGGGGKLMPLLIEHEILAANGYAVFDPHLPVGRKRPLAEIGEVVKAATDGLIASPYADPQRLALMGQSYGCYTVTCVLVQSDRYRTAVVCNGITDLPHMFAYGWNGYCEAGQGRMDATIWEERDRYIENSPYYFFDKLRTPILFLAGSADQVSTRMLNGAYTALKRLDRVAEYREYKGEPHGPGAWTAKHQRDMVAAILDWFGRTLKAE